MKLHAKKAEYTFIAYAHGMSSSIDHIPKSQNKPQQI